MGIFIKIDLEEDRLSSELRKQLVSVCPVDIFKMEGEGVAVRPEQEDECTLCELCLNVAPARALTIRKLYSDQSLVSRGPNQQSKQEIENPSSSRS
jgi:NAD-dependent dihydropyrimidine dehydrogenase PreA subunit